MTLAGTSDTARVDAQDARHAWHPFTPMTEYGAHPRVHIERGEGCWLVDTEGRRYLDGSASLWTNVHGHNHPELNAAIVAQLNKVAHATLLGLNHPVAAELAAKLSEQLTGGALPRAFYTDNGSCAAEVAIKLSLQHRQLSGDTHRTGIVAMEDAYHGDTFGTMSVGDGGVFHGRFRPWCFAVERFPAPDHVEVAGRILRSDASRSLAALEKLFAEKGATLSCLILEPRVQGAAGMKQQPAGFVRAVSEICRRHGVHLILDEVFTGFGRLGGWLAAHDEGPLAASDAPRRERACSRSDAPDPTAREQARSLRQATDATEGVTPDFLVLAKGLTGGYLPLAATLTREDIYQNFLGAVDEWRTFYHGHTFTGNPLACAVALKSMELLEPLIASGELAAKARLFGELVRDTFAGHPNIREIRHLGFTAALDLQPARPGETWSTNDRTGMRVAYEARKHGLLIRPLGDSLLLVPAPAMPVSELRMLCEGTLMAMESSL